MSRNEMWSNQNRPMNGKIGYAKFGVVAMKGLPKVKEVWVDNGGIPVVVTGVYSTLSKRVAYKKKGYSGTERLTDFLYNYKPLWWSK